MLQHTVVKHVHEPFASVHESFTNVSESFANADELSAMFFLQSTITRLLLFRHYTLVKFINVHLKSSLAAL